MSECKNQDFTLSITLILSTKFPNGVHPSMNSTRAIPGTNRHHSEKALFLIFKSVFLLLGHLQLFSTHGKFPETIFLIMK